MIHIEIQNQEHMLGVFVSKLIRSCYFHEVLQPDNLVFRMLPYLFTQRDVHSTTVRESLKPRLELSAHTHDALRPACRTSSGCSVVPVFLVLQIAEHFISSFVRIHILNRLSARAERYICYTYTSLQIYNMEQL
jgi:hypothetical protein